MIKLIQGGLNQTELVSHVEVWFCAREFSLKTKNCYLYNSTTLHIILKKIIKQWNFLLSQNLNNAGLGWLGQRRIQDPLKHL